MHADLAPRTVSKFCLEISKRSCKVLGAESGCRIVPCLSSPVKFDFFCV